MTTIAIRRVTPATLSLFDRAMHALAEDLGDPHRSDSAGLAKAVCGPDAWCIALLAVEAGQPVGAVLGAPYFSTTRGGAGLFVTDLWVAKPARGQGLGRRLLAASLEVAAGQDAARFLKLAVYKDNPAAFAAYQRMGFVALGAETNMILVAQALDNFRGTE